MPGTAVLYLMALASAVILNLCFPIAGPVPVWRLGFAFVGAWPMLLALAGRSAERPRFLVESWLLGWCFGASWYAINCY